MSLPHTSWVSSSTNSLRTLAHSVPLLAMRLSLDFLVLSLNSRILPMDYQKASTIVVVIPKWLPPSSKTSPYYCNQVFLKRQSSKGGQTGRQRSSLRVQGVKPQLACMLKSTIDFFKL